MRLPLAPKKTLLPTACLLALLSTTPLSAQDAKAPTQIAVFDLGGTVSERPGDPLSEIFGSGHALVLKDLLERLGRARDDEAISAVVLEIEGLGLGLAQLQEVRQAIAGLRAASKPVLIHADSLSNGGYALASAATRFSMVPTGDLFLTGLYAEQPYLKGLLDKIDVQADYVHIGDYKSAGELFTNAGPSPAAEENMNWLLDGLYGALVGMIAESRGVSADKAKAWINEGPYTAESALAAGLIDAVEHREGFVEMLHDRFGEVKLVRDYGEDAGPKLPDNPFEMFSFFTKALEGKKKSDKPCVAVVYVEGEISLGSESVDPFGGGSGAKSTSIRKALDRAADDDTIKAVVLRVDSPGGSATASEIIWNATQRVAAKKPLIVSMGNVAGSGGYYVSCGAHEIFADEATITASIGVVGGKFVTTPMWNDLGVTWKEYKRGAASGMMSSAKPFTTDERRRIVGWMTEIYDVFKEHVREGRAGKLTKPLEEMCGGRVFTGKQALALGLVDRLGGLDDAIAFAAERAELGGDYPVRVVPEPKNLLEVLLEDLSGGGSDDQHLSLRADRSLFAAGSPLLDAVLPMLRSLDPLRANALLSSLRKLELLHREGVVTVMPETLVIE